MRIREATLADAEEILALYQAAYSVHNDPHRPPYAALRDTLDDVRAYVRDSRVLVALDDAGRIVGTVATRRLANVRRLAVAPDAKENGIGGALLEAAVECAAKDGFEFAELDTLSGHPWLPQFYMRHRFHERGVMRMKDGTEWINLRRKL